MKTLHLNLKRKWFDMILSGEKKEEYREIKGYWQTRLCGNDPDDQGFYYFDTITFTNGYAKDAPKFIIDLIDIRVDFGNPEWGAEEGVKYFVLRLGDIHG